MKDYFFNVTLRPEAYNAAFSVYPGTPQLRSSKDVYPGGMLQPNRQYSIEDYRYSFNGQEKSPEIAPNTMTALFWEYDARILRRWNVDPVLKEFESPYLCFSGNPVLLSDPLGDDSGDSPYDNPKAERSREKYKRKYEKMLRKNPNATHQDMEDKYNGKRWMWIRQTNKLAGYGKNDNSNTANYWHAGDLYREHYEKPKEAELEDVGRGVARDPVAGQDGWYAMYKLKSTEVGTLDVSVTNTTDQTWQVTLNQSRFKVVRNTLSTTNIDGPDNVAPNAEVHQGASAVDPKKGNYIMVFATSTGSTGTFKFKIKARFTPPSHPVLKHPVGITEGKNKPSPHKLNQHTIGLLNEERRLKIMMKKL